MSTRLAAALIALAKLLGIAGGAHHDMHMIGLHGDDVQPPAALPREFNDRLLDNTVLFEIQSHCFKSGVFPRPSF